MLSFSLWSNSWSFFGDVFRQNVQFSFVGTEPCMDLFAKVCYRIVHLKILHVRLVFPCPSWV